MASNLPDFERTSPRRARAALVGRYVVLRCLVRDGSGAGAAQQGMRQGKLMLTGTGRGDGDMDPAHTDLDQRADLEQFQPDVAATGPGELGKASPIRRSAQSST